MTVVIDGTNGISGVDGTASSPSYEGTDSNTGIFFPAADTIAFAEGGAEVARFDSAGNFGIGTSSPSGKLSIETIGTGEIGQIATTLGSTGATTARFRLGAAASTNGLGCDIKTVTDYSSTTATSLTFSTTPSGAVSNASPTERMRIDSSGNVGIGTSSPGTKLNVQTAGADVEIRASTTSSGDVRIGFDATGAFYNWIQTQRSSGTMQFAVANTQQAAITTAGLFQFNSGYGSVATVYGCRAWVNFDGTGTYSPNPSTSKIRAAGNVTSITKNATGDYTVNFTNAMPDANYAPVFFSDANSAIILPQPTVISSGSVRFTSKNGAGTAYDGTNTGVAIFR